MSHCILRFVRSSAYVTLPDAQVCTPLGGRHQRRDEGWRACSHCSSRRPGICRSSTRYQDQLDLSAPTKSLLLLVRHTVKDALFKSLVKHIRYPVLFAFLFVNQHLLMSGALSCDFRCNVFAAMRSLTIYTDHTYSLTRIYIFTPPACTYSFHPTPPRPFCSIHHSQNSIAFAFMVPPGLREVHAHQQVSDWVQYWFSTSPLSTFTLVHE